MEELLAAAPMSGWAVADGAAVAGGLVTAMVGLGGADVALAGGLVGATAGADGLHAAANRPTPVPPANWRNVRRLIDPVAICIRRSPFQPGNVPPRASHVNLLAFVGYPALRLA